MQNKPELATCDTYLGVSHVYNVLVSLYTLHDIEAIAV